MIYVNTNSDSIYYNLATEYYLATEFFPDDDIFLLWRTTPSLVIGKYQNTLEEIDAAYARESGISVVRRMSGGGTMYLDKGGWQFTFITRSLDVNMGIEFERFIMPIVSALGELGIKADLTGRNDITVGGKKVSGNSQFRLGPTTVHHGTLLFDSNVENLVRATTPKDYKITSKAIRSVRERVTNIREHLEEDMNSDEFARFLISRLTDREHILSEEEKAAISAVSKEKFDNPEIIYASTPKFEIEKTVSLEGGHFEIGLTVKKGIIESAGIMGDFFSDSSDDISGSLIGVRYTPEDVKNALAPFDGKLFRASVKDLVHGIFE